MKKIIFLTLCFPTLTFAQTADMVSLGAGYANESYYSFENGEEANVDNYNWDLAFEINPYGAAVRLNRKNCTLWLYPGTIADWSTLDTTGMAATWEQYINGYEAWEQGAFNIPADPADGFDLGWGVYNSITHVITGNKIFVVKLADDSYRKLIIDNVSGGAFNFKYDQLDNSNEVVASITKSTYVGKNFVYYDLATSTVIDREPTSTEWDVVFTNYILELAPGYFSGTTGALHNKGVATSQVDGVATSSSTYGSFEDEINTIGYDWKIFDMGTFSFSLVDDLSYFVLTATGDVWKLVFTDFEGSSNGNIHFTKEKVETAGIPTYEGANIAVYPNPASDVLNISTTRVLQKLTITDLSGQVAKELNTLGFSSIQISTTDLKNGVYFIRTLDEFNRTGIKRIVIQH